MLVCFVVEAFDGGFLECPVHAFDLSVGPRVAWFGQPVIDATLGTCVFESMREEWLAQIHARRISAAAEQMLPGEVKCVPLSVSTVWIV